MQKFKIYFTLQTTARLKCYAYTLLIEQNGSHPPFLNLQINISESRITLNHLPCQTIQMTESSQYFAAPKAATVTHIATQLFGCRRKQFARHLLNT